MTFAQSNITVEFNDAPVRSCLEMLFKQANINNYVIDNEVSGFVTMKITDQPFENSLKLVMRASTYPLTYVKENNIYIVKVRKITQEIVSKPNIVEIKQSNIVFERIPLTFIDPLDLMVVLGQITYIRQGTRMWNSGNSFNNQTGAFNGMMGGNGGFGGGRNF
jgi:type II secretory pathway component GspD/PulD (secretin)